MSRPDDDLTRHEAGGWADATRHEPVPDRTRLDPPPEATRFDAPADETRHEPGTSPFPSYGNASVPSSADEEIRLRFGAGPTAPKVWTPTPRKRRRSRIAPLISIAVSTVIIVGVAWYLLQSRGELAVSAVKVEAPAGVQQCDRRSGSREVTVKAVVELNGKAGDLSYRWTQSDEKAPQGVRTLRVGSGDKTATIPLLWRVNGKGRATLTATFELLLPEQRTAKATFRYSCT